jgi:SPP1 gp7 family putative phage head morphogenesis protein
MISMLVDETVRASLDSRVLPELGGLVARVDLKRPGSPRADADRADGWPEDVALMREKMTLDLDQTIPQIERTASSLAVDLYGQNRNQWRKIQKAMLGVEAIGQNEAWAGEMLESWVGSNVSLIKKLTADVSTNVEGIVSRGLQTGLRVEEITKQLVGELGESKKARNRAKFIARDQIAKLNGQITQARQTELGVKRYVWRTADDERVRGRPGGVYPNARPAHWILKGKTCRWDDGTVVLSGEKWIKRSSLSPAGYEGHPGQDYQCRCYAEPVLDEVLTAPEE